MTNLKNQIVIKPKTKNKKKSSYDKTQKLKLWQILKTQIVGKLKFFGFYQTENLNSDKTKKNFKP